MLEAFVPPFIVATCPAHLNLLDLMALSVLGESDVPLREFLSTPYSHPSSDQIFASGSCFQMPLACFPPLMYEINFS